MKFHSKPVDEHAEVPLADEGRWEAIVARWAQPGGDPEPATGRSPERGRPIYVLSITRPGGSDLAPARLAELRGLIEAQGDHVCGEESHLLAKPDPRTLLRSGVAERIGEQARAAGAALLAIDAEISPSQTRNLEHVTRLPICDREAVILNVFARQATTRRARVQVEIAHLEYLRPRIRGIGLDMDQQTGGVVGSRGPGETASELLARRLDGRLAELRRTLAQLGQAQAVERRRRGACARVALVGYTNAGKTSLMNALTDAGLSARDRPFETLDATSRSLSRHGRHVLLSDTVGFIRYLPPRLLASFESTLAEVREASLLLWVLDLSDPEVEQHRDTTRSVLERLGADSIPRIVVLNKLDRCEHLRSEAELGELADGSPHLAVSAHDPESVSLLRAAILRAARADDPVREVFVRYEREDLVSQIYATCRVLATHATPHGTQFVIEGPGYAVERIVRASKRRSQ